MAGGGVIHSNIDHSQIKLDYKAQAWVVVMFAALFFFYEFIQMNMFNAISMPLMQAFHIDATTLGEISSYYFISNVIFLFVAGSLLDRFSTKLIILVSLGICILGTLLFSFANSIGIAEFCRFLTGIGSAFCFLSCIRLASRWFPPRRMALATGFIVTMAMIGGTVAQTPLTLLVSAVGWRHALLFDAGLGLIVFLIIVGMVKDCPRSICREEYSYKAALKKIGYWQSLRMAFLRIQNWLGGIYTCLMNLPLILLGGLWGSLYLMDTSHLTKVQASVVISMLFIGTIFGSPISGWLSDAIGRRRRPMIWGGVISLFFLIAVLYFHHFSYTGLIVMFLLIGFVTSTQIIGYPVVAENSPRMITAMSVSVVNITAMAGIAIFQPVFGFLMDLHREHRPHILQHKAHALVKYAASDFHWAMLMFPIGILLAILSAVAIKETFCNSYEEHQ